jgi:Arc/MetJ-type ribon-helix-helix transcriptional regulator
MESSLPADIQQRIDAQRAAGYFADASEVLREALNGLERRQRGLEKLREQVLVAEDDVTAERVGTFDRDEIKRAVRRRLLSEGLAEDRCPSQFVLRLPTKIYATLRIRLARKVHALRLRIELSTNWSIAVSSSHSSQNCHGWEPRHLNFAVCVCFPIGDR